MRKLILSLLAVAVLAGAAHLCPAQTELKPLVTVSFSGYDKLFSDIGMIGELGGNPDLGKGLEMMLKLMTQGQGLAGLDTKQPWGAMLVTDGQSTFVPYGFLPVTDLKRLAKLFEDNPQFGKIENKDGVYQLQIGGATVFVTQKDKWAVIARTNEELSNAPAAPAKLLAELSERYDVAVRGSVKNTPEQFRDYFLAQVQAGSQMGMEQMPNEADEDYALRTSVAKQAMEQMTMMVNELDEIQIGWNIDQKSKTSYLEVEATAQSGTKLAGQLALVKKGKTSFGGFLSDTATVSGNWLGTFSDADVAQAKMGLADLRKRAAEGIDKQELPEEQAKLANQLLTDAVAVLEKTIEAKKIEGGLALHLASDAITFVAGSAIADGAKLDKLVKQVVAEVTKSDPTIGELIKLDVETVEGVHFHAITVPTPDPSAVPFFGETVDIVLGIADDKLLIAVGRNAADTLKEAVTQSKAKRDKEVLPLQISVAVGQVAKFMSEVGEEEQVKASAGAVAEALEKTDGKDHVTLTSRPIANGVRVRLEAEEGLLIVVGSMSGMMSPGGAMEESAEKAGDEKAGDEKAGDEKASDEKASDEKDEKPGDEK